MHPAIESALVAHKLMGHKVRMYKIRFHKLDGEVNFESLILRQPIKVYQDHLELFITQRMDFTLALHDVYKKYVGLEVKAEVNHGTKITITSDDVELIAQVLIAVKDDFAEALTKCPEAQERIKELNSYICNQPKWNFSI